MKLKAKTFEWLAGRPVAILNDKTAKKLNIHIDERILIRSEKKSINTIIDIFPKLIKKDEIGLSTELAKILGIKSGQKIEVSTSEISEAGELIKKKIEGYELTKKEIGIIISELVHNNLTEAEIAYFAAAEKIEGMSPKEIADLTSAMVKHGEVLKFNKKIVADKHSIGGIAGNRTTPIVVAICAAAGLTLPKTSSRAITSAAGTADVIETISKVEFSGKELKRIVQKAGASLAWGGALNLAPSDDKIIKIERILNLDIEPQLLASILSKKIAAGSTHVLIDIPYGKSAKVKSLSAAKKLGNRFIQASKHFKIKIKVVYTDGSQPIGNGIGPNLEMLDVLAVLQNRPDAPKDLRKKSLYLSQELMKLCKIKNAKKKAKEILESGKAYEKFKEIINTQNGKKDFDKRTSKLTLGKYKKAIKSKQSGKIKEIDNKKINTLCRILGSPETNTAGARLHAQIGKIQKNENLITLYSESKKRLKDGATYYKEFKPIIIK